MTGREKKTELWPKPETAGAVGFWTAQGPTVCGGSGEGNQCFLYKEHQWIPWTPWTNMGTARQKASTLQIGPNQALTIGGITIRDGGITIGDGGTVDLKKGKISQ